MNTTCSPALRAIGETCRAVVVFGLLTVVLAACAYSPPQTAAPKLITEFPVLPFADAVMMAATELVDKAASALADNAAESPRVLTIDPLIDSRSGVQSVATRSMGTRIAALVRAQYPQFEVRDFTTETLRASPLVLIGTLTALDKDGRPTGTQRDSYRIWLTLIDLQASKVIAKARARARLETVDVAPTPHFRDAPVWAEDRATEAYINTCHTTKVGGPIPPEYLDQILAAALATDAIEAYEAGRYQEALDLYLSARGLRGGNQLRVYNGIYLANRKLGRGADAAEAFGDLVDYGLRTGHLAVKFLFRPGSTAFWPNPEVPHDMWLQQLAARTGQGTACLEITGHTSRAGPEPLNERLSVLRAEFIKRRLKQEASALGGRMIANGVGSRETIIGTGTDDARDALDRRVTFTPIRGQGCSTLIRRDRMASYL
jgi:hypothetical protein